MSVSIRPADSTNTTIMPSYTTPRTAYPSAVDSPTMAGDAPLTSASNNANASWDRPNPHSIPNSKTSQYIDKITSENDRLRRELHAEKLLREEESKRVSAARGAAEDSRAELQHLQVLADTNARAIERKDRKLDELRASLEAEVKRRRSAEQRAEEALKMLGDTRSETQRQLSQAYEMKGMAETYLDTARDGFKRIVDGYERKVRAINDEVNELRRVRLQDADKIKRQAVVVEQLHHEMSRTCRAEAKLNNLMQTYRLEHGRELDTLVREAQTMRRALPAKEQEAQKLVQQMEQTRDKMKWVVTQQERQQEQQQQQEQRQDWDGRQEQQQQQVPLHSRQASRPLSSTQSDHRLRLEKQQQREQQLEQQQQQQQHQPRRNNQQTGIP